MIIRLFVGGGGIEALCRCGETVLWMCGTYGSLLAVVFYRTNGLSRALVARVWFYSGHSISSLLHLFRFRVVRGFTLVGSVNRMSNSICTSGLFSCHSIEFSKGRVFIAFSILSL